jgi:hypothetical protein
MELEKSSSFDHELTVAAAHERPLALWSSAIMGW